MWSTHVQDASLRRSLTYFVAKGFRGLLGVRSSAAKV